MQLQIETVNITALPDVCVISFYWKLLSKAAFHIFWSLISLTGNHRELDNKSLTSHAGHNTADVLCDSEYMCDCQSIQQLVLREKHKRLLTAYAYTPHSTSDVATVMTAGESDHMLSENTDTQTSVCLLMCSLILTGTFFCVTTTAQSFPLTATEVSPPWLMALKAYSEDTDTRVQEQTAHQLKLFLHWGKHFVYKQPSELVVCVCYCTVTWNIMISHLLYQLVWG